MKLIGYPTLITKSVDKMTPPEYIIEKLGLMANTVNLLCGGSGEGKSLLVSDLAVCVATGADFFGGKVKKGRVVHFDLEQDEYTNKSRYSRLIEGRGLSQGEYDIAVYSLDKAIDHPEMTESDRSEIVAACKNAKLIIVDSFTRTSFADENSTEADTALYLWKKIGASVGATVIIIHHKGKSEKNAYRGSSAIKCAVDCFWELSKKGETITVSNHKSRLGGLLDPFSYVIKDDGEYIPEHKTYEKLCLVQTDGKSDDLDDAILALIDKSATGELQQKELLKMLKASGSGRRTASILAQLKTMINLGVLASREHKGALFLSRPARDENSVFGE